MRERIARAIEIAIVERTMHHPAKIYWAMLKWLWPLVADAVLDAMREPTEAMIEAGEFAICSEPHCECRPNNIFTAMIDAALKVREPAK